MLSRLPRLTFLVRFALVTFVSAAVAAVVLALVLQHLHRHAVEADETRDAVARVEAIFTPFTDRLARGPVSQKELAQAARTADVFNYVIGVRLYDDRGAAIFPADGFPQREIVRGTVAREDTSIVDIGDTRVAYAPLSTSDGSRTYVIAIMLSAGQMAVRSGGESWVIAAVTGGGVLLVFISVVTLAAGASRELERRRRESQSTFVDTLALMARMLDLRDPYTAGHSERVARYARAIAVEMRLPPREIELIHSGALLHDLGKIAVPDAVLFKPARLDADERRLIEVHPGVGAQLLGSIASMEDVVPCVLHHHERIDGHGYPRGLLGDDIPLGARVIAVADSFDAMTTDRPYRLGLTMSAALAEIVTHAGTQFDVRCATAFGQLVARGEIVPPEPVGQVVFARKAYFDLAAEGAALSRGG